MFLEGELKVRVVKEAVDSAYRGMYSVAKEDIAGNKQSFDTAMEYLAIAVEADDYEGMAKWSKRAQEFLGEINTNLTMLKWVGNHFGKH